MEEDRSKADHEENARTLPVVLHSLLSGENLSATHSVGVSYEHAAWRHFLEACGGQTSIGGTGPVPAEFASKADGFLRAALASPFPPRGSGERSYLSTLATVIYRWRPAGAQYEEQEDTLLNGSMEKKDGYLCGNKSVIKVVVDDRSAARSGHTGALPSNSPSYQEWMTASVAEYMKWHTKRISLLRRRMLAREHGRSRTLVKDKNPSTSGEGGSQEVVRVGQLGSAEGRAFSFASLVFFDDFSRGSVQLLSAEETLTRQCAAVGKSRSRKSESGGEPASADHEMNSTKPEEAPCVKKELHEADGKPTKCDRAEVAGTCKIAAADLADEVCLYRGQVVQLRGLVKEDEFGVKLIVSSIKGGPPLPPPRYLWCQPLFPLAGEYNRNEDLPHVTTEELYQGHPVHIMVASAQMLETTGSRSRVRLLEMELLLTRVRERAPHILIMFGPVVPSSGPGDADVLDPDKFNGLPDMRLLYRDFFRLLKHRLSGIRTRVFVIPSSADIAHATPLPQPPYSAQLYAKSLLRSPQQHQQPQIQFLPNPAFLRVNELELLLTSADPLLEIGPDLCYTRNCCGSRQELIVACCESLLRQRTLFPAGTCAGTPVEPTLFPPLMFDASGQHGTRAPCKSESHTNSSSGVNTAHTSDTAEANDDSASGCPHIIIFPSNANFCPAAKNGGAFACFVSGRLVVIPYSPRTLETADRAEWTSLYIHPPIGEKRHVYSELPGQVKETSETNDFSCAAGKVPCSTEERSVWLPIELEKRVTVRHVSCFAQ